MGQKTTQFTISEQMHTLSAILECESFTGWPHYQKSKQNKTKKTATATKKTNPANVLMLQMQINWKL